MNFHLMSRSTAIENNLKHYFTGKPCSRGVVWLRYSSNKKCCCPKCRDFKNKITRDWNNRNQEERKAYYAANRDKILARDKERYYSDLNYQSMKYKRYADRNKEAIKRRRSAWDKSNKDKTRRYASTRRAAQLNATPLWFGELDEFVMSEACDVAAMRTESTGVNWHVDHMIPLQAKNACGLHVWNNIQVIPAHLNLFKNNRMIMTQPFEWVGFAF